MKRLLFAAFVLFQTITLSAQTWNTTGNSGLNSGNYLGTTDNTPLILKSNNIERLKIDPAGGVTVSKDENTYFEVKNSNGVFQIGRSNCDGCFGGNRGATVLRNLDLNSEGSQNIILALPNNHNDGNTFIGVQDAHNGTWLKFFNNATARFDGRIYAKEVQVKANVWADYLFAKNYELKTLEEVEKHIIAKGHLPNIPSEKDVLQHGINVAEMNAKLLEKVEELTLYSIEQNKKLKSQSEEISELRTLVNKILNEKK